MAEPERPQIYLITPPEFELSSFPKRLAAVLEAHPVACIRLSLATRDEDRIARAADALREVAHAHDVAMVIETHLGMVERLGLDGVHLADGARSVRAARKALGPDAIVGAFCGASRHDGMSAGEAGADYVSFGPLTASALGDGTVADAGLFAWWTEMIEVPVVAEGLVTDRAVSHLWQVTDFFAIGEEIWKGDDAASALGSLMAEMV
jgi:thiamine-phosphate pyrophosphorylase